MLVLLHLSQCHANQLNVWLSSYQPPTFVVRRFRAWLHIFLSSELGMTSGGGLRLSGILTLSMKSNVSRFFVVHSVRAHNWNLMILHGTETCMQVVHCVISISCLVKFNFPTFSPKHCTCSLKYRRQLHMTRNMYRHLGIVNRNFFDVFF